jgi:hypothetical protein
MRQVYVKEVIRTEAATPTYYTKDDPVKPGKVLKVLSLALTWDGFKTSENAQFFIEDAGTKIYFGEDAPVKESGHAFWTGEVYVGEGDRVAAYTPDSASADEIHLFIIGELWDLKDWAKGME